MTRHLHRHLTTAALTLGLAVAGLTPAQADETTPTPSTDAKTVRMTTHDILTAEECVTPVVTLDASDVLGPETDYPTPSGYHASGSWLAGLIRVTDPRGSVFYQRAMSRDRFNGDSPVNGEHLPPLCGATRPNGTYTVELSWEVRSEFDEVLRTGVATGTFTYTKTTKATTRIGFSKWPNGRSGWTYRGHLLRRGSAYAGHNLDVQMRFAGRWHSMGVVKATGRDGFAVWHTPRRLPKGAGTFVYRIRFAGDPLTHPSTSAPFRLPRR